MACVIFNLNVRHDEEGRAKAALDFQCLIDRVQEQEGAFCLTYQIHASREQVHKAYPNFPAFLAEKNATPAMSGVAIGFGITILVCRELR